MKHKLVRQSFKGLTKSPINCERRSKLTNADVLHPVHLLWCATIDFSYYSLCSQYEKIQGQETCLLRQMFVQGGAAGILEKGLPWLAKRSQEFSFESINLVILMQLCDLNQLESAGELLVMT